MTPPERIMAVLRGQPVDRVPFTAYPGDPRPIDETIDFLGKENIGFTSAGYPYKIEHPGCTVKEETYEQGGEKLKKVVTETPKGNLEELYRFDPTFESEWHVEFPIKTPEDYDIYSEMMENAIITENYEEFEKEKAEFSEIGHLMAWTGRSPYQRLAIKLVGLMNLGLHLMDCPEKVERAMEAMREAHRKIMKIIIGSSAEIVNIGDNINAPMVGLERFEKYCVPLYNETVEMLEGTDKLVFVHMDGSLRPLRDAISRCKHHVVESFCCIPDGDVSIAEAVEWWPDKIIWPNFTSSIHLCEPKVIREHADMILNEGAPSGRLLIGLMENIPPFAWKKSLPPIVQAIEDYGEPAAHEK